jgi:hypothetical protein
MAPRRSGRARRLSFGVLDGLGQLHKTDAEGLGDTPDRRPLRTRMAVLDLLVGAGGQASIEGDRFLGDVPLFAQVLQDGGEGLIGYRRGGGWHARKHPMPTYPSPRV